MPNSCHFAADLNRSKLRLDTSGALKLPLHRDNPDQPAILAVRIHGNYEGTKSKKSIDLRPIRQPDVTAFSAGTI